MAIAEEDITLQATEFPEFRVRLRLIVFSPPLASHVAVYSALAEALAARGHECFLLHHPGTAPLIRSPALKLLPLDAAACAWSPQSALAHARKPALPFGVLRLVRDMAAMTETLCRQAPALVKRLGADGIVSDQMESAGALVAEACGLPFVTVAAALPINREPLVPLNVLPWPYEEGGRAEKRNRGGARVADLLTAPLDRTIAREAERLGVAAKQRQSDCLSPLAEICQCVPGFDFPRHTLPPTFHYVGTIRSPGARGGSLSIAPRRDKPFVFASLGTLQGHRLRIFRRIAQACGQAGAQCLVAHCGGLTPDQAKTIDADWVVDRVSQEAAIARADVVVTHGGLNTALDALEAGKPTLCLPLAFDQPGVGARIKRLGAGEVLSPRAGASRMAEALRALLRDSRFRENAGSLRAEFANAGGAERAADIIEQAVRTRRPVAAAPEQAAA